MKTSTALGTFVTVIGGGAAIAAAYWALLNVPESSVGALALSALLVLVIVALAAYSIATALGIADGVAIRTALRNGMQGLPGFLVGGVIFALIWWFTTAIDTQWQIHRGEIDALFLRYLGTANTGWLHTTAAWLTWLVRWGIGLAVVVGATGGRVYGLGLRRGLDRALSVRPVTATVLMLVAGWGLWQLAYWRPGALPANQAEVVFVSVKLAGLVLLGGLAATIVLHVFARELRS